MAEIRKNSDYVVIAPIFSSENINISLTFKGKHTRDNLYILNEFPYNKKDLRIFKNLFFVFSSKERPKEFVDFFVIDDKFYAVFKYVESESVSEKYKKGLTTAHFKERCTVLEKILIKIDKIYNLPSEIVSCVTEPANIHVDNNKNIHFIYDLHNILKYQREQSPKFKSDDKHAIYQNIHEIIFTILKPEAEAGFNKALHIVLDKCKRQVYTSVPELVIELKKAETLSQANSWIKYLKYQASLRKPLLARLRQIGMTSLIAIGIIYLAYSKITENTTPLASASVAIGDITYSANAKDESDKAVSTENEDNQTNDTSPSDIVLTEGLDMEYEDYIVQYDDTMASICDSYYKDSKFVTAVATFNGLQTNEKLTAGTILKLPNRTAIALYISR